MSSDCPHCGLEGEESVVELALGTRTETQFNTVTQTETLFHTTAFSTVSRNPPEKHQCHSLDNQEAVHTGVDRKQHAVHQQA